MSFSSFFRRSHVWGTRRQAGQGHAIRQLRFETFEDRRMLNHTAVNYPTHDPSRRLT
jgi:hypothetical protein